jgi:membrane protein implicated in regulation of membrane protease activity
VAFFWLVVALAFVVAEVVTLAFFAGFFAVAALGGALAAALGGDFLTQGLVVFVISVAGIALARPPLMRYLTRRRSGPIVSGAQEMVGKVGVVEDRITGAAEHERGHVRILGESWLAVSADGSAVDAGREVRVIDIQRTTLVVEPLPQPAAPPAKPAEPSRNS